LNFFINSAALSHVVAPGKLYAALNFLFYVDSQKFFAPPNTIKFSPSPGQLPPVKHGSVHKPLVSGILTI